VRQAASAARQTFSAASAERRGHLYYDVELLLSCAGAQGPKGELEFPIPELVEIKQARLARAPANHRPRRTCVGSW